MDTAGSTECYYASDRTERHCVCLAMETASRKVE